MSPNLDTDTRHMLPNHDIMKEGVIQIWVKSALLPCEGGHPGRRASFNDSSRGPIRQTTADLFQVAPPSHANPKGLVWAATESSALRPLLGNSGLVTAAQPAGRLVRSSQRASWLLLRTPSGLRWGLSKAARRQRFRQTNTTLPATQSCPP